MQIFVDADAVDYKLISICHKGPRKRTAEDDEHFRASFEKIIYMAMLPDR